MPREFERLGHQAGDLGAGPETIETIVTRLIRSRHQCETHLVETLIPGLRRAKEHRPVKRRWSGSEDGVYGPGLSSEPGQGMAGQGRTTILDVSDGTPGEEACDGCRVCLADGLLGLPLPQPPGFRETHPTLFSPAERSSPKLSAHWSLLTQRRCWGRLSRDAATAPATAQWSLTKM